jgi:ArsR family transcriptional regulator, lead/cadmium/zinc/bismuth-responsive transcriptional repressor
MNMDNHVAAACDDSCAGSEVNIENIKSKLIPESTAAQLADLFKALGDPTRVKIIHALVQSELCVHDLTEVLSMGQSAVSHQLRLLRNMRIVKRRKVGKTVFYSLDDDHVEQIFLLTLQHLKHE